MEATRVTVSPSLLDRKVRDLFAARGIDAHLDLVPSGNIALRDGLARLQASVYRLDAYYEGTWKVSSTAREVLWRDIETHLASVAGDAHPVRLVADIKSYEAIEGGFRTGNLDGGLDLWSMYKLKTCDVRLCRRVIEGPHMGWAGRERLKAWRIFDVLTEILDDIDDLEEDAGNFNGNRLILAAGVLGQEGALRQFTDLLSALESVLWTSVATSEERAIRYPLALAGQALRSAWARIGDLSSAGQQLEGRWLASPLCRQLRLVLPPGRLRVG